MLKGKKLVAGVMTFAMLLGIGSSLSPVDAVVQKPDTGKTKRVVNIYLHGLNGSSYSLSTLTSTISGISIAKATEAVRLSRIGETTTEDDIKVKKQKYLYAGQEKTFYFSYNKKKKRIASYFANNDEYKNNSKEKGIQLVFIENDLSLDTQLKFLDRVIKENVRKDTQVNLIGHSMGGLLAVVYAKNHQDYKTSTSEPKINKIVTVASPLQGVGYKKLNSLYSGYTGTEAYRDLLDGSGALKKLYSSKRLLNKNIKVYSIVGGGELFFSDENALSLKNYTKRDGFSFKGRVIGNSNHFQIMHDKEAMKSVKEFLKD